MIFTFYSYKGGVGRSMALANVAELLCAKGSNVLMIDWDLESPGLDKFFPSVTNIAQQHVGLIDLLWSYKEIAARTPPSTDDDLPFGKISDYVIDLSPYMDQRSTGVVRLLSAGKRDGLNFVHYADRVKSFDWVDFYENWAGEQYFEWLRQQLERLAPIILIDSRSGVNEMSGVCTFQLADVVIAFTSSSRQSIEGTSTFINRLRSERLSAIRAGRSKLNTIIVPARVEQTELVQRNRFEKIFREEFDNWLPVTWHTEERSFWSLSVPYVPLYAFEELVAVREKGDRSAPELVRAYEGLWQAMVDVVMPPGEEPWRWRQRGSDVLIIEDTPAWERLLREIVVNKTGGLCDSATTREAALKLIKERDYRFIMLNLNLSTPESGDELGYEGLDILEFLKVTGRRIPVLIVTGMTGISTGNIYRRFSDVVDIVFKGAEEKTFEKLVSVIGRYRANAPGLALK